MTPQFRSILTICCRCAHGFLIFRHVFFGSQVFLCPSQQRSAERMAASPQKTCRLCAHTYALEAGRMHGPTFKCHTCLNAEQTIRRNLGDTQDLYRGGNKKSAKAFTSDCIKRKSSVEASCSGRLCAQAWSTLSARERWHGLNRRVTCLLCHCLCGWHVAGIRLLLKVNQMNFQPNMAVRSTKFPSERFVGQKSLNMKSRSFCNEKETRHRNVKAKASKPLASAQAWMYQSKRTRGRKAQRRKRRRQKLKQQP